MLQSSRELAANAAARDVQDSKLALKERADALVVQVREAGGWGSGPISAAAGLAPQELTCP